MRFELELLRTFRLHDRVLGVDTSLRTNSQILAFLALSPRSRTRQEVLDAVWPGVDASAARNRLRVALSQLRTQLPSALIEDEEGLWLDQREVDCDAWELEKEIASASETVSEADELKHLLEALEKVEGGLAWVHLAPEFIRVLVTACLRAADLALALEHYDDALRATSIGLGLDASHPSLWASYLTANWRQGMGAAAVQRLKATKDTELLANPTITALIEQIRMDPEPNSTGLPAAESRLLIELFEVLIAARPEICRTVLASPQSLPLSGKYPRQMHNILERVVIDPAETDEAWERCMARLIGLKAWLNDVPGVLASADKIIDTSQNATVLRAVWNAVAVAHSLARNWPAAMAALDKTMKYAEETGIKMDMLSAQGNRAFFLFQQGKYEEAEAQYEIALKPLAGSEVPREQFEYAIGMGNRAFIPLFQGQWALAESLLTEAIALRTDRLGIKVGLLQTALGLAKAQQDSFDEVASLVRAGFLDAFSTDSSRDQQITFEFAAGALACTAEREYAVAVLKWVDQWRERTGLPRSKAELELCARFGQTAVITPIATDASPSEVGRELMRRLRRSVR